MGRSSTEKGNQSGHVVSGVCRRSRLGLSQGGVTLPLLAEFCTNPVDAAPATKQDSELKAFYRVAKRLFGSLKY